MVHSTVCLTLYSAEYMCVVEWVTLCKKRIFLSVQPLSSGNGTPEPGKKTAH